MTLSISNLFPFSLIFIIYSILFSLKGSFFNFQKTIFIRKFVTIKGVI